MKNLEIATAEKDLTFLREMKNRFDAGRGGDPTQLEYVENMINDWIFELSQSIDATKMQVMVSVNRTSIICDSYESGYGHGLKCDGLDLSKTPYSDEEFGKAYQIGYEAGLQLFKFRQAGYANMGKVFGS